MSDASRHALHYILESVYGTTPATPAFKRLRHTATTLGVSRSSLQSEELREDRQIADFRLGTVSVGGDANGEVSFGSYDDFLEAVLMGTWNPKAATEGSTFSAANADASFNDSANGFVTAGFQVGDVIISSGFAEAANNGNFVITSVAAGKLIVDNADDTPAVLTDEAAGEAVGIETNEQHLIAGTVRRSFSILRHFTDIPDGSGKPYHTFNGIELNSLNVSINPTSILTVGFGTLGREGVLAETAAAGSTFAPAPTTTPLDPFSGVIRDENEAIIGIMSEASFTLENGLEPRNVIGSKFSIRPSVGRSNLTGTGSIWFEDSSYVERFLDETPSAFSFEFPDEAGNKYIFELPRFKFTGGQPDVSGQGSITLPMPFQGIYDPTVGSNIRIRRFPALV